LVSFGFHHWYLLVSAIGIFWFPHWYLLVTSLVSSGFHRSQKMQMVENRRYQWWKPEAIFLKIEQHELTNNRWLNPSAFYIKTN
jgi:hypothetical protein